MNEKIRELLRSARVEVSPETYALVSLRDEDWRRLLENPELSPRMTAPFMIFKDKWEVTLILDDIDYATCRHAMRDAKVENGFRLVSFNIVLGLDVVGFLAEVSRILAAAGVSIIALSSFSRDHLLIRQNDLGIALRALGEHVGELC